MNDELNRKLNESLDMVSKLLNEDVKAFFININNGNILINSKTSDIVNLTIKKKDIGNIDIKGTLEEKLNIKLNGIEDVPIEYYKDYSRRYFTIGIDKNSILNLDSEYIYTNINNIYDATSLNVLRELLK